MRRTMQRLVDLSVCATAVEPKTRTQDGSFISVDVQSNLRSVSWEISMRRFVPEMTPLATYSPTAALTAAWIMGVREAPPVRMTLVTLSWE